MEVSKSARKKLRFPDIPMNYFPDSYCKSFGSCLKYYVIVNFVLVVLSILTSFVDVITDLFVGCQYLWQKHYVWAGLTFGMIIFPTIVVQAFSARWYISDGGDKESKYFFWTSHILPLQPYARYYRILRNLLHINCKEDLEECFKDQNDASLLRLMEAFLEASPQLVLQLYIVFYTSHSTWLTIISAIFSSISISWSVASHWHCLRQAFSPEYKYSFINQILITLYHILLITSRILAIVCLASIIKAYIFIVLSVHTIIMFVWIVLQKTDFCNSKVEEILYNMVASCIHIFTFFNLKSGRTRLRMLFYYIIVAVENSIFVAIWFVKAPERLHLKIIGLSLVIATFILGICILLVYYRFFHPNGEISWTFSEKMVIKETPKNATQFPKSFQHFSIDTSACLNFTNAPNFKKESPLKFDLTDFLNESEHDSFKSDEPKLKSMKIIREK